jgi:hypothetical protein
MNPKSLTTEERQKAEEKLARLPGVIACRLQTGAKGEVLEVHLEVARGADRVAVTREVEAALKRDFGLAIDGSHITVSTSADAAQPDVEEFPILEFASRFAFVSVNVVSSREGIRAEVELTRESLHAFGAASTDNIALPAWSVVAEATLRAVSEFLDDATRLCLIGVVKAPLGDDDAMLVRVDVVSSRCTKSLAGCALAGGNENQGVVFATLDAVNRVIGKLDFKTSIEYKIQ